MSLIYYDRSGAPIAMEDWARLHADREYQRIAQHWVRGWMVSTVWLGIDHGFGLSDAPLIFETMIFPPGDEAGEFGVWDGQYCERHPTEEAAQAGHDRALSLVCERLGDDSANDIISAAQFSDPATVPGDPSSLA